jgi:hypothetical protein
MMELKTYISETLKHIIDGVKNAQEYAKDNNAVISGSEFILLNTKSSSTLVFWDQSDETPVQNIEFDVEVTTVENNEISGGMGIFVGPVSAGVKGGSKGQNSLTNHLRFSIPLKIPSQLQEKRNKGY